ncbi:FAE1/Type III polyketide synthase-like protein [Sesbania bispinosa]|nr:FAE1/Type III polyketide synthase-like protein [Sesbania bispinosa]
MYESNLKSPLIQSNLPDFKQSVSLKYVKLSYQYLITRGMVLLLPPLVFVIAAHLSTYSVQNLHDDLDHLRYNLLFVVICSALIVFFLTLHLLTRARPVYLVDFSCYKHEDARQCTRLVFMDHVSLIGTFTQQSLEFQQKILERSGFGESTYLVHWHVSSCL